MKAGLEVHQQLATSKLFCACPSELSETVVATTTRNLRATGGEDRAVDAAAAFQAARGLTYRYESTSTSCLVELDEEPPHALNRDALEVALTMALALKARPVDEVEVMRKIVVDGSNTAGFQRTVLVASDGSLEVAGKQVSIQTVCLEEDAARKVGEGTGELHYRLDRLGIPLIEIATGPEIRSGEEARAVAEEIGALLRATGRVRRGIGTIREDLNVSADGGARVEIKGVQELRLIAQYVDGEVRRQEMLLRAREELSRRHASVDEDPPVDVSALLRPSGGGIVGEVLSSGGVVLALALRGFAGLLKGNQAEGDRLGRELADYVRPAGLGGILHSDELPGPGVGPEEVVHVRERLSLTEQDAFVLVAARDAAKATEGLRRVRERARRAIEEVPTETRDPLPDGRSRYSRPLPGRDRMYPETDIPPIGIDGEWLSRLSTTLPEFPRVARQRVADTYRINLEVVRELQASGELERFERLTAKAHAAPLVARLLTRDLPSLQRAEGAGGTEADFSDDQLHEMMLAVERGDFAKEGMAKVLEVLAHGGCDVAEAAVRSGVRGGSEVDLDRLADEVVRANESLLRERGREAFSPLMGDMMTKVRGRRDGKAVADALRRALNRYVAATGTDATGSR